MLMSWPGWTTGRFGFGGIDEAPDSLAKEAVLRTASNEINVNEKRSDEMKSLKRPGPGYDLYGVYHHHEYGGTVYLLWSDHHPSEEEVTVACGIDFEADRDEWICIDPVIDAAISTAPRQS